MRRSSLASDRTGRPADQRAYGMSADLLTPICKSMPQIRRISGKSCSGPVPLRLRRSSITRMWETSLRAGLRTCSSFGERNRSAEILIKHWRCSRTRMTAASRLWSWAAGLSMVKEIFWLILQEMRNLSRMEPMTAVWKHFPTNIFTFPSCLGV